MTNNSSGAARFENRARLQRDTSAYFVALPAKAVREERGLEKSLGELADEVDFAAESRNT